MRRGGILHRDISVGNILIIDDPEEQEQFCGFIHDFDYSSMSLDVPQGNISSLSATALNELLAADDPDEQLKERTVRKRSCRLVVSITLTAGTGKIGRAHV